MARFSIPKELVLDADFQFKSNEFSTFAKNYGFKQTLTSPYHHQANGMTESAVKRNKKVIRVAKTTKRDPYLILLDNRNTPQEGMDVSPVQRFMSRRTRTALSMSPNLLEPEIIPSIQNKIKQRQARQQKYYSQGATNLAQRNDSDQVLMQ